MREGIPTKGDSAPDQILRFNRFAMVQKFYLDNLIYFSLFQLIWGGSPTAIQF